LRQANGLSGIFPGLRRYSNLGKSEVKKLQPGCVNQNVSGLQIPEVMRCRSFKSGEES
jgi:hypothetical protein